MANTFTTDFTDRAVKDLAKDTMQIVQVSNTDKDNGLAPKEMLGSYDGKLMLFDPEIAKLTPEKKIEMARSAEEVGLKFDKRIKNANGTTWNDSQFAVTLGEFGRLCRPISGQRRRAFRRASCRGRGRNEADRRALHLRTISQHAGDAAVYRRRGRPPRVIRKAWAGGR